MLQNLAESFACPKSRDVHSRASAEGYVNSALQVTLDTCDDRATFPLVKCVLDGVQMGSLLIR